METVLAFLEDTFMPATLLPEGQGWPGHLVPHALGILGIWVLMHKLYGKLHGIEKAAYPLLGGLIYAECCKRLINNSALS